MATAQAIVEHDQIRKWAEARGARPACVKGTGGRNDPGMIRLDFPGFSGKESLQEISWREWFRQFDENNLALVVQESTSRGQRSNFNKLVRRGTATGGGRRSQRSSQTQAPRKKAARAGKTSASGRRGSSAKQDGRSSASRKTARGDSTRKRSVKATSRKRSAAAKTTRRTQ